MWPEANASLIQFVAFFVFVYLFAKTKPHFTSRQPVTHPRWRTERPSASVHQTTSSVSPWCSRVQDEQEAPLSHCEGSDNMQSHLSTRTTFSGSVRTVNTFGLWRDNFAANPLSIFDVGHGRAVFTRVYSSSFFTSLWALDSAPQFRFGN